MSFARLGLLFSWVGGSLAASACGSGNTQSAAPVGTQAAEQPAQAPTSRRVVGQAAMGPLEGSTVTAFQLKADGAFGDNLGTVTTQADGSFSLDVLVPGDGAVAFAVQGGQYKDEATGAVVPLGTQAGAEGNVQAAADGNTLQTWVADVRETSQVAVTALTTMAAGYARKALQSGSSDLGQAISGGRTQVGQFFADPNGQTLIDFDITTTLPLPLTAGGALAAGDKRGAYGSLLSGFSQLAAESSQDGKGGLTVVAQLVAIAHLEAKAFADALSQAHASVDGNSAVDASLFGRGDLGALAQLGAQIVRALPRAIDTFLKEKDISGSGPGKQSLPSTGDGSATDVTIAGSAWLGGPIEGGAVTAWALSANGHIVEGEGPVGQATTQADGAFSFKLKRPGWTRVRVAGGTFHDKIFDPNAPAVTVGHVTTDFMVPADMQGPSLMRAVNPVTSMVSERFTALLGKGGSDPRAAMEAAQADVRHAFGMMEMDLSLVQAVDLTHHVSPQQVANAQVALVPALAVRALGGAVPAPITAMGTAVEALARDMSNGRLDGKGDLDVQVVINVQGLSYSTYLSNLAGAAAGITGSLGGLVDVHEQVQLNVVIGP